MWSGVGEEIKAADNFYKVQELKLITLVLLKDKRLAYNPHFHVNKGTSEFLL